MCLCKQTLLVCIYLPPTPIHAIYLMNVCLFIGSLGMCVAGGESSREREAGAGERTPRGPGDPALEASQRAG